MVPASYRPWVDKVGEIIASFEKALEIEPGFFVELLEEPNDWAFLIKVQVLVEGALTYSIAAALHNDAVKSVVAEMSLQGKASKRALAEALGLIDRQGSTVISQLAFFRNQFAHNLRNVNGSLDAFAGALTFEQKVEFMLACGWLSQQSDKTERESGVAAMSKRFRTALWFAVGLLLSGLAVHRMRAELWALERDNWRQAYELSKVPPP